MNKRKLMSNISRILMIFGVFVLGIATGLIIEKSKPIKVITLTNTDTTLVNKVKELEEQNELLLDELQLKESEISYWGRKYDELKHKRND
jgi:hypothetical protein